MSIRFKTSLAAGLVAISMAGAAAFAHAQAPGQDGMKQRSGGPGRMGGGPMRGPGPGFGLPLRALDLSEDQQAQLKKIAEARQPEFKAAGDKVRAARESMRALLEAETINEGAIRAKSAEVAAAEAEAAILNAKMRQETLQILTAEQQAKLKELRASREGKMQQRRGPRGQ